MIARSTQSRLTTSTSAAVSMPNATATDHADAFRTPRPLKVMVVARLFAGLADSLASGHWQPRGIPAIYKLLERLAVDPSIELCTVFTVKDGHDGRFDRAMTVALPPLGNVYVLPYRRRDWLARLRLDGKWRELRHLLGILDIYSDFRPDIAYFTNANFIAAALFARLHLCRTVLRFLGLHPEQQHLAEGPRGLQRWLYESPFDQVICSLDGSGVEYYLPRLLGSETPRAVLLNGVDRPTIEPAARSAVEAAAPADGRLVVLFVGRLEPNKGGQQFVEAILRVAQARPEKLCGIVIGDGSERALLTRCIVEAKAEDTVRLLGAVPHTAVSAWLERAQVYVSLNQFGNLSNANLEALAAGTCIVILDADPQRHLDEETTRLIPPDAALRIGRDDVVMNLVHALTALVDDPSRIAAYAQAAGRLGGTLLRPWAVRIDEEITLLRG